MKHEMTVHEALSKLKVLNKRIDVRKTWLLVTKANEKKVNGQDINDVKENISSDYQSTVDLIRERNALKKAVNKYNAETSISINGEQMTVAEAIYMKDFGINSYRDLLYSLQCAYSNAVNIITEKNGKELDDRAEKFVSATFGSKDKVSADEVDKAMRTFRENNIAIIVDPIGIQKEIDKLQKYVDGFESSVDSAIQVANATHIIDVDF